MLSPEDRAILDLEAGWWLLPGPKEQAIEQCLGLSADLYYQRLLELVAYPAARAYDPLTVKRVLAMIEDPVDEVTAAR
jgi:hypothetical protein